MAKPVIMPRQGQSVETCIITQWNKKKGDAVKIGDILFSYETDKASFDFETRDEGILLDVFFKGGDEVPVLTNVAVIGSAGEDTEPFRPGVAPAGIKEELHTADADNVTQRQKSVPLDIQVRISPRARNMAAKMGLDIAGIVGSGPNGRIIARDVEMMAGQKPIQAGQQEREFTPSAGTAEYSDKKISNVRRIIARTMHESISTSAQLTHHMSADVRRLLALRNQVKILLEKEAVPDITLNDMICFSVIRALEKHPEINSHFLGEISRTFKKVHLGLAVDTPRGLLVPAIRNADDYSLRGLSVRLHEVADQCRKGNINPELLSATAASFTVSNLGSYGVEMFTPVINLPQVAILGVNTIIYRPANMGDGVFGFVPMIGLSLTYDHRAVDGGPATLFLKEVRNQIENFNEKT